MDGTRYPAATRGDLEKMRTGIMLCSFLTLVSHILIQTPQKPDKQIAQPVRMIELLGNPDRFNGEVVTLIGYLVIGGQNVNAESTLSIDKEDYDNELSNGMGVVPSEDMLRNRRELTGMYVRMTGRIVTRDWPRGRMLAIEDITQCKIWSDPDHPRAAKRPNPEFNPK